MTGTERETHVREALALCSRSVEPLGRGRWGLGLGNGTPFEASARLGDGWIVLEARPLLPRPATLAWELLRLNAALAGGAKFTLPPVAAALELRAEVPAGQDTTATRLGEACRSFEDAFGLIEGGMLSRRPHDDAADRPQEIDASGAPGRPPDRAASVETGELDLPRLLSEAGWTRAERTAGDLAVPLDVPGVRQEASVERRAHGQVRVAVDVAAGKPLPHPVRQALGRLLLAGTRGVRMVRAGATTGAADAARLEVSFRSPPSAAELDLALEALSVACRSFGREAKALVRGDLARAYLESLDRAVHEPAGCSSESAGCH